MSHLNRNIMIWKIIVWALAHMVTSSQWLSGASEDSGFENLRAQGRLAYKAGLSILGAFLGVLQNILRHVIFVAWFRWFNNIQHRNQSSKLWPEPGCESHRNVAEARQKQTGMQAECTWRHRALTHHKTYSYNSKPRPRLNWLAAKPYKWWPQNKAWNSPILNYPDPFLQMMSKSWTFRKFKTSDVSHQLDHLEPASFDQLKLCLSIVSFSNPKMESSHSPNHLHIYCRFYIIDIIVFSIN